jgi:glutamine amidotransferase
VFRSIEPAWHDQNLRSLAEAIESPLFFCHVRAAAGPPIQQTNCHPFRYEGWLFMHNGGIADFARVKRDLVLAVDPELYPFMLGTTDTEVLFHLALTFGLRVERVGHERGTRFPFQGSVAITDGVTVWAFRYSSQGRSRTLFHSSDIADLRTMYPTEQRLSLLSDDAHVIVSEPINDLPGAFLEVPESSLAILDESGYRHADFVPTA